MPRFVGVPLLVLSMASGCATIKKEERQLESEEQVIAAKAAPYLNACKNELIKLCKSAGNDHGKQLDCLKKNQGQAVSTCRAALDQHKL